MDCNKDEAVKAKELAEKKFIATDVKGARKFAMKAHNLFPELDGLQALIATLNIYHSADRKLYGEVDWYGVLGVDPSSDDDTVKRQYRKLALILHPDKNKSVGAEGAFKILSEAWSLLSDKAKRRAYDQKRTSSRGIYEKVIPNHPSKPASRDGLQPSVNNGYSNGMSQNGPNPHLVPPPRRNTFWTVCTSCKMQFEYVMLYLNKKLECYNCKKHFLAIPIIPPQTNFQSAHAPQDPSSHVAGTMNSSTHGRTFASTPASVSAGYSGVPPAYSSAEQGKNGAQFPGGSAKRMHQNSQGEKPRKRRRAGIQKANDSGILKHEQLSTGSDTFGINGVQRNIAEAEKVVTVGTSSRDLSPLEIRNMLVDVAKKEICKKLNEWKSTTAMPKGLTKPGASSEPKNSVEDIYTSSPDSSSAVSGTQASEHASLSMTVPDADFHTFDDDRNENSFGDSQVWAAYDDDDGMPRYYAMIHSVISRNPFKMRISWLNSKSTAEFGPMNWVGCGFYKTSGEFRVGKHELNKTVASFSHRVKWAKGARGAIRIFPNKGEVWALYKDWSSEWDEHTPEAVIHQYDMVEVLADYNEDKGVIVIPLVKVPGFKTVFRQHMDQEKVRVIPREEMFRFSHQVPSYLITGQESPNAPKGCLDLDPAATQVELLQVITETNDHTRDEKSEAVGRDDSSDTQKNRVKDPTGSEITKNDVRMVEDGIRVQLGTATVG